VPDFDEMMKRHLVMSIRSAMSEKASGSVESEQFRVAFLLAEGLAQHFGAERRAAHAAHHRVLELTHVADAIRELDEVVLDADHHVGHGQPAERVLDDLLVRFVRLPKRGVLVPDAAHHVAFVRFLDRPRDRLTILSQRCRQPLVDA
jgi:hypothetical protein